MGYDTCAVPGNDEEGCCGGVLFWIGREGTVGGVGQVVLAEDIV